MTARTIGLIGGMSWESTALYYKLINQHVAERLGNLHSASIIIHSYDFEPIKVLQYAERWDLAGDDLARTARRLEEGGADCILIGTNTMHIVADRVADGINVPLLHIADCTADRIIDAGIKSVGLLGTKFTMEKQLLRRPAAQPRPASDRARCLSAGIWSTASSMTSSASAS